MDTTVYRRFSYSVLQLLMVVTYVHTPDCGCSFPHINDLLNWLNTCTWFHRFFYGLAWCPIIQSRLSGTLMLKLIAHIQPSVWYLGPVRPHLYEIRNFQPRTSTEKNDSVLTNTVSNTNELDIMCNKVNNISFGFES